MLDCIFHNSPEHGGHGTDSFICFGTRAVALRKPKFLRWMPPEESLFSLSAPRYLCQEPRPSFGLVDPNLDQTVSGDIVVMVANLMGGAQRPRQQLVVIA